MEPRIQYAQTKDGVSIAYWTLGEGMPLVQMPPAPGNIRLEWQDVQWRSWYEQLARERMLIRYDGRGTGLSDRDVVDYSLDTLVLDLEAVAERLGLEKFAIIAPLDSGPLSIVYAVRHPERVSHLVLWCSFARGSDFASSAQMQALRALIEKDYNLFTETMGFYAFGWSERERAMAFAQVYRESITQEAAEARLAAQDKFDVSDLLQQVASPTVVGHRREVPFPSLSVARVLAARIPDARLVVFEGEAIAPWMGDMDGLIEAIDEFLSEGEETAAGAEAPETGAFRTVLFTDVEGSTALTQRLGDAKARELLREHERMVREALKAHGGSELKTTGDGFMASFSSATRALESAIAMQRAFAAHNESAEEPILVRVGMNAGEPIAEDEDLFGTAVIEAARIAAAAKGGEILVSNVVRELAKGKDFLFADRGEVALKGFDEPVRLYEVRWQDN